MGRPMFGPPGVPADRLKILREAYAKTMKDPQLQAEVKKRNYEFDPVSVPTQLRGNLSIKTEVIKQADGGNNLDT